MQDPLCSHIVWVSKEVVEGPEARFIWILSHEIGHHTQDTQGDVTGPVNDFIRATAPRVLGESLAPV